MSEYKCIRCGKCCTRSVDELKPAFRKLVMEQIEGSKLAIPLEVKYMYVESRGKCKHLIIHDGKAACSIYEDRPDMCKNHECWTSSDFAASFVHAFSFFQGQLKHRKIKNPFKADKVFKTLTNECVEKLRKEGVIAAL